MSSNLSVALDQMQQAIVCLGGELVSLIHTAGIDAGTTVAVAQIANMLQEAVVKLGEIQLIP